METNASKEVTLTITLDHQIVPGHWTVIRANSNLEGTGDQIMREDPWDRIELGFLPGDADADNEVDSDDHTRIADVLQSQYPPNLLLHDINRSGTITNADKVRIEELLQGTDTTQAWNHYELPHRPD